MLGGQTTLHERSALAVYIANVLGPDNWTKKVVSRGVSTAINLDVPINLLGSF